MELVGEEKKIQTLFSELRLADERTAPSFSATWNRAQARALRPRRAFNLSFVGATALLVCALVSLALWSSHWHQSAQPSVATSISSNKTPPTSAILTPPGNNRDTKNSSSAGRHSEASARLRANRLAARRETRLLAALRKEATAISSWQSPTATLLSSPNDELLKSLPQLNENVNELKSFLPNKPK